MRPLVLCEIGHIADSGMSEDVSKALAEVEHEAITVLHKIEVDR